MKRIIVIAAMAAMLFSAPYVGSDSISFTAEAGIGIRKIEGDISAVCFRDGEKVGVKKFRVHFDKSGVPDRVIGAGAVYSCDTSAPNGNWYQYYFYKDDMVCYFNL